MRKKPWLAVLLIYIAFIYINSLMPAAESSRQSGFVLQTIQHFLAFVGLGDVGITEHMIRKGAHFTEYTGFGILLFLCLNQYRMVGWERQLLTVAAGFFVPFVDETIQLFTPGRSGQVSDVWLDMSGVAVGTVIIWLCLRNRIEKRGYAVGKRKKY